MSRWQNLKDVLAGEQEHLSEYSFLESLLKDIGYIAPGEYFPDDPKTIERLWDVVREKSREKRINCILQGQDGNFIVKLPDGEDELEIILDYVNKSIGVKKDQNTIWIELLSSRDYYSGWQSTGPGPGAIFNGSGTTGVTPSVFVKTSYP